MTGAWKDMLGERRDVGFDSERGGPARSDVFSIDPEAGRPQPSTAEIVNAIPSYLGWFLQTVAWDGALPFAAISIVLLVSVAFPFPPAIVGATIAVPTLVAIVRAELGNRRLVQQFGDRPPRHRQIAFASAIVALFGFELFAGALAQGLPNGPPPALVPTTVALYFVYLLCILTALRPSRKERTHSEG